MSERYVSEKVWLPACLTRPRKAALEHGHFLITIKLVQNSSCGTSFLKKLSCWRVEALRFDLRHEELKLVAGIFMGMNVTSRKPRKGAHASARGVSYPLRLLKPRPSIASS